MSRPGSYPEVDWPGIEDHVNATLPRTVRTTLQIHDLEAVWHHLYCQSFLAAVIYHTEE